jgi:hypothetical protein
MLRQEVNILADNQPTETELQRNHLIKGLRRELDQKLVQLEREFGLSDDEAPKTFNEFIKRIKAGDIIYDGSKDEDYEHGSSPYYNIRWRNPKKKEDRAGFYEAEKDLLKKYQAAKDEIVVLSLEQALAAKRLFETTA